ncbi:MAG: aminoglycoside 6-adenylyltransferase [Eubacteriales bacterium]|nr:aminoglycoside 6-adenylyltransferase [Eubacteriales bacterium]
MRAPEEIMKLIMGFANEDDRVRIVGMEGSRVNINIPKDKFQDFDITYFVNDISEFTKNDDWLSYFGSIIMMQKPEDMELFPAELEGYSYLMLFDDYNKIDLTLLEKRHIPYYLKHDKLRTILLDKDDDINHDTPATDEEYWLKKPSARSFDDCCNEFWHLATYIVKALCRKEILSAIDTLYLMNKELLRMISWKIGFEYGFHFSVGKSYKFINKYISKELWEELMSTYCQGSYEMAWESLFKNLEIFKKISGECSVSFDYEYPLYDKNVSKYVIDMFEEYGK